jgi:hypothetical protein
MNIMSKSIIEFQSNNELLLWIQYQQQHFFITYQKMKPPNFILKIFYVHKVSCRMFFPIISNLYICC